MKAIILGAGFSTRLYPLTLNYPKALLTINNQPIISYVLNQIISLKKINETALVTNNRYYIPFKQFLANRYPNKVKLINNNIDQVEDRLGAIGDIQYVLEKTGWQDDILVLASDTLTSLKIKDITSFFLRQRGIVTAFFDCGHKETIKKKLGCALLKDNRVIKFVEKPKNPFSTITAIPYYIFPKESLSLIEKYFREKNPADSPGLIIPWLMARTKVFAYNIGRGFYFDVGTFETYNHLKNMPSTLTALNS
jgi:glucose-1-phosphate thymidylyltransferase